MQSGVLETMQHSDASPTPSRISTLAVTISQQLASLDRYHHEQNVPELSFAESAAVEHEYPSELQQSRAAVANACQELLDLMSGPRGMMRNQLGSQYIYYDLIHNFQIAEKVPLNGKIGYRELSNATRVGEAELRRILRYAITNRIFAEHEPGFLSHSAASRVLAEDQGMVDTIGSYVQEMFPAILNQTEALARWPDADEPSQTGYMIGHDADETSFYLHMAKFPERARQFASAMSMFGQGPRFAYRHLVDNYPWASLGSGVVVDLGGSVGGAAFALAEEFPDLCVIVQDLPNTIAAAREKPGVKVTFMVHDFFDEQPVKGADVYLCRWCFHNWPDKYCVRILRALIPALKPGAKVLIMDAIMPKLGTVGNYRERGVRNFDINMMMLGNAMERELADWESLFTEADKRFRWLGVTEPEGSQLALIEAVWEPDDRS